MKSKRFLAVLCLLLCVVMAFGLAACGGDEDKNPNNGGNSGTNTDGDGGAKVEAKVTVTFKNGDTVVDTVEIVKGTAVTATTKTVTAPEGKQFKSWQKDGADWDFATKVNENITLTATFEDIPAPKYTITFKNAAGNVLGSFEVEENGYIDAAKVPTAPTEEHKTFVKWVNEADDTMQLDYDSEVRADATYIPVYETSEYTVTIKDADTNEVLATQEIPYGGKVTPFTAPVGKEIVSVKLGDADFDYETYTVEGNIEILVKLAAANRTVKITGEGMDFTFTVPKGGTLSDTDRAALLTALQTAPAENYYWVLDLTKLVNVQEDVTVNVTKVTTSDYKSQASWIGLNSGTSAATNEKYNVTLGFEGDATKKANRQSWGTVFWQAGQYVEITVNAAGEFRFDFNADKNGQNYTVNAYVDGVLFATETFETPRRSANITFKGVPAGEHVIRVEIAAASYTGEPLGEWAGLTISGFRPYEAKPTTATVTFKNGNDVFSTVEVARGTAVAAPEENPTLRYFLFDKWLLGGIAYDFTTAVDDNITLTASFTRDPAYVKVSFVADGKTYTEDVYLAVNGTVTAPEGTPAKDGYLFQYWAKQGETTAYDFTAAISEDLTLEAYFKLDANEYTLTFMNGTEKAGELKIIEGNSGTLPTPPNGYYWTATAEEYAKLFNVTENRTITLGTTSTSAYADDTKRWMNNASAGETIPAALNGAYTVDFVTGGWAFASAPVQQAGAYFTLTGDFASLNANFWVDKGGVAVYKIYVDGQLVKTMTLDATEERIPGATYTVLSSTEMAAGVHTIKIEVVEGNGQITAYQVKRAPLASE